MTLLALAPAGYALLALLLFSIWVAFRIKQRLKGKSGCLFMGYVTTVVFCIGMLSLGVTYFLISYTYVKVETVTLGKSYTAEIVDYTEKEGVDDEGRTYVNYYPVFKFNTSDGKTITRESAESISYSDLKLGSTETVFYYSAKDRLTTLGATTAIAFCGTLLMAILLVSSFIGIILYALGYNMARFWKIAMGVLFYFFLPFAMIAFDALLIYALLYGNIGGAFWVEALLVFFIIMLTLAIWGYLSMMMKKGLPKMKRTSATTWTGDWED